MKKFLIKIKEFFVHESKTENIYNLDGYVPFIKAIPFGLQHVLAMFVANITPIIIIMGVINRGELTSMLIQNAMMIAGIGTIIQLFPIWKIGAKLPIVVGVSFTFLSVFIYVGSKYGYGTMVGSIIIGGIFIGILGLFAKYWRRFIRPIVSSSVVLAIGFSLLSVGAESFGGGLSSPTFASWQNLTVGFITLASCIIFSIIAKGKLKALSILLGLVVGYIASLCFGIVDFSGFEGVKIFSLPRLTNFSEIRFNFSAIISVCLIYLVATTEAIGDVSALTSSGLNRDATDKEIAGAIACDGFTSALSGCFGCMPLTTFSQNVGLVGMTKVVNRFTILMGALFMILASLFPAIGVALASVPSSVLGGCTIMLFGSIVVTGMEMVSKCGFNARNITILSIAMGVGIGFSLVPSIFMNAPEIIKIIGSNPVATVFLITLILDYILPKEKNQTASNINEETSDNKKMN